MAFRLLEHFTDIPSYKYVSEPDLVIEGSACEGLRPALAELETGRPLQYVLGVTEFCGHRFKVGEGCLIPRPETEELVSRIIDDLYADDDNESDAASDEDGPFSILDICTGSGCIAWSLAAEFPEAMVYGCDLSDAALRYACRQRVKVRGAKPVFFAADVLAAPPAGLPKFDIIVSNPPYICDSERAAMRPNVLDFEPPRPSSSPTTIRCASTAPSPAGPTRSCAPTATSISKSTSASVPPSPPFSPVPRYFRTSTARTASLSANR